MCNHKALPNTLKLNVLFVEFYLPKKCVHYIHTSIFDIVDITAWVDVSNLKNCKHGLGQY